MADDFDPDFVNSFELETWTRCAADYLDGFAGMTRETFPMLIEAAGITRGQTVLDVGSGPGHISGALSELGCFATGIDFSQAMVDVATARYPGARFHQGNAEELPFENDIFDSAVSNFVVHHLARPQTVFGQISRVLKRNGKIAYTVFADPEAQSSIGAFFAAVEEHHTVDDLPHGPLFGVTDLDIHSGMLENGGLCNPEFEFKEFTWKTESPMPVLNSFVGWANLASFPEDLRRKIEETTLENLEQYKTEDGYEFPHKVLIGSAVKL
jgi:ubiquinone/menaquinone biosynthesis C-methylase UbiE